MEKKEAFTKDQEREIDRTAIALDCALILETMSKAIADNKHLRKEFDYLKARAAAYEKYGLEHGEGFISECKGEPVALRKRNRERVVIDVP